MEDRISDNEYTIFNLENKVDQTEKMVRNHECNLQELWDIMKRPLKDYWDWGRHRDTNQRNEHLQWNNILKFPKPEEWNGKSNTRVLQSPGAENYNRSTPSHIIMKILYMQNKVRILRDVRENHQIICKGKPKDISRFLSPGPKIKKGLEQYISSS